VRADDALPAFGGIDPARREAYRAGVHKRLLLLGLLLRGPMHGYELARIVAAHGELYQDLKKANIYYLLERLTQDGHVEVRTQTGTRGRRGERLVYRITRRGRREFRRLLGDVLDQFDPAHTGVDVAVVYLSSLTKPEAIELLERRRQAVADRRTEMAAELAKAELASPFAQLAGDHLVCLVDAELSWLGRAVETLRKIDWPAQVGGALDEHSEASPSYRSAPRR
jgi:DNA-binding PadR family transcriptional regulator